VRQATNSRARVLGAALVGTSVEFYDFYIYSTAAALVLGPLFFPSDQPGLDLLLSYASFSVAFFARPVGAIAFGHFGDRIGRKSTLVASLLIMGLSTFLIAFLPGYNTIGWAAPVLLCLLRFGQGFGLGGEWAGAALLAVENAPAGQRARYGMFPQLGAPVGFILSNGFFILLGMWLSDGQFMDWGWRIPFLGSAALIAVGLWVRLRIAETPRFAEALERERPPSIPIAAVFRQHPRAVIAATFACVISFSIFYTTTAFALGYATSELGIARDAFLKYQLLAILFLAVGIVVSGFACDYFGGRRVLMASCALTIPVALAMAPLLGGSPAEIVTFLSAGFFAMGLCYGPVGSFLPTLFPPLLRYSGMSFAFNMAGILGGGLTPLFAQGLTMHYGLAAVGYYLAATAALSFLGVLLAGNRVWADLAAQGEATTA